jgi:hypothetical protein
MGVLERLFEKSLGGLSLRFVGVEVDARGLERAA